MVTETLAKRTIFIKMARDFQEENNITSVDKEWSGVGGDVERKQKRRGKEENHLQTSRHQ